MFKEEQIEVQYGSLIQLSTALQEDSADEPLTIVCKKFNRTHTQLVRDSQLEWLEHYDNSFFQMEYERYSEDNHSTVCFSDLFRLKHVCSGQYLTVEEWVTNGNMNATLSQQYFGQNKELSREERINYLDQSLLLTENDEDVQKMENRKVGSIFQIRPLRSFEKSMSVVKASSRFSIYCPKFDVHLCRQTINDTDVLVGMVEPSSSHYGWRLRDIKTTSHPAHHIHNFDLVYITNRNSSGKLTVRDKDLVVEEPNPLYPLKSEPKSFECLWRVTDLMSNKYERVKEMFKDSANSPASDLQVVFFSNAILNPFLKDYQLEREEELDLSSITLTHLLSKTNFAGPEGSAYIRFSTTDSMYEVNVNLNTADYINICKKDGSRLNWLVKRPQDKNQSRRVRDTEWTERASESSTFRVYRVPMDTKSVVYQLLEAHEKLDDYLKFLRENQNWRFTSAQLKRVHARNYAEARYAMRYLKNRLEDPQKKLMYQTMMYDIGLVRLMLQFLKYLYQITTMPRVIISLKPLESPIGRSFRDLHIIFRLSCVGNNYNKERILKEGASQLLTLSLQSRSRFMEVQLETLKEILDSSHYAEENTTRSKQISGLVKVFSTMQPRTLEKEYLFLKIMRLLTRSGEQIIPQNQRTIIKEVFREDGHNIRRIKFMMGKKIAAHKATSAEAKRVMVSIGQHLHEVEKVKWLWQQEQSDIDERGLLDLHEFYRNANEPTREQYEIGIVLLPLMEHILPFSHEEQERRKIRDTLRQQLSNLWRVLEEWIELLSDVCEGRNIQGKWIAQSIINPHVLVAILDDNDTSQNNIMHSCFVRLANNMLVETLWNPLKHFSRVWLDRTLGMKHYHIEEAKHHTDIQSYQKFAYPALEQYVKKFIHHFLERYPNEGGKNWNEKEYKGLADRFLLYSTSVKYMELTTRVMRLLRNMVCHNVWETINSDKSEAACAKLMGFLVEMLSRVQTWDGSDFKIEILRIINFFLDEDAEFRLHKVIQLIKEQRNQSFKDGILNEEKVYDTKLWCISDNNIVRLEYLLVHLMLTVYKSNTELYSLCFRTRQRIMEVERNSLMARRYATIFELSLESVKIMELLNEARHIFRLVLVPGGLRKLQIKNQYILAMPIWDADGPCVIKIMLDITEAMKSPANRQVHYSKIYSSLGSCRRTMQPYCQTQRPSESVQRLVMEMGVIEPVMKFLQNCDIESTSKLYVKLIEAAYLMVAVYMWNNEECKAKWVSYYHVMIRHAQHSVGALIALREYCRNSYWLQCDDDKVGHIVNSISKYLVTELYVRKRYTKACRLLDFFSCMVYYKNKFLDTNRMKILLKIVDNDYPRICNPDMLVEIQSLVNIIRRNSDRNHGMAIPQIKKTTSFDPQTFQLIQDEQDSDDSLDRSQQSPDLVKYSPKLTYVIVLFRLLADLVKNHPTNTAKCKKLHPPSKITLVIENAKDCWALKASARRLLNNLYYSNMEDRFFEIILSKDIPNMIYDLNEYIFLRKHDQKGHLQRQQYEFQVREVMPMSMLTHNIIKVLDSLQILFRSENTDNTKPCEANNFMPNRSRFLNEIILSLQSQESVSKQLYLKESMKEVSEVQQEDQRELDTLKLPKESLPQSGSEVSQEVGSDKSPRDSQSPNSSRIKEGHMNITNLPVGVQPNTPYDDLPSGSFNKINIKRSESIDYNETKKRGQSLTGRPDAANEDISVDEGSQFINQEYKQGPRNNSEKLRQKSRLLRMNDRDSERSSEHSSVAAEFYRKSVNQITSKRRMFIRDDWKHHYNMLRVRTRKNWQFNVSIFVLFVRIYERVKYMLSLFAKKSSTSAQLASIMRSLESTFFEVDLQKHSFTYSYDRKSSFLYLNLMQDLLLLDKKNRRIEDIRIREWMANHKLLTEPRHDNTSVAADHKIRSSSLLGKINQERENWETVTAKLKKEEGEVYELLERILQADHIGCFFEDRELYQLNLKYSNIMLSIYEPSNSIERIRALMQTSSLNTLVVSEEDEYQQSFSDYYRQKIFNDYESCRQFKQAKLYMPRLMPSEQPHEQTKLQMQDFITRMDMLDSSINELLEGNTQSLDEDLLEFHYRVLTKRLRRDGNKESSKPDPLATSYRDHILNELNSSVCNKIFHTIVKFNLEDNFKLTHELFFFSVNYFGNCQLTDSPQPLFELVKSDQRNLFISKIDSLIEFFVGDIVRNYELEQLRDSSSVSIDYIFRPHEHAVDRPPEETVKNLQKSINRRYTFECCKNIYASLQLLCQNNFVAFKREFCEQTQSDGRIKPNNRNLLIRSTIELRKVFAVFSDRINDLPFKIINFLNEIAQIPCYENQLELAESTFFEDVCNFLINREHIRPSQEGFSPKESTLKEIVIIIQEFLKIVVSLLESNRQDIYTYFCDRFDHRFIREIPKIYRELLISIVSKAQQRSVIDEKVRKMKAVFVIMYKLLNSYPLKASHLLQHMKRIFDQDEKHDQEEQRRGVTNQVMEKSLKHMSRASRSVGKLLSKRVELFWRKSTKLMFRMLSAMVVPWRDQYGVIPPNILHSPGDDRLIDSEDQLKFQAQPSPIEPLRYERLLKPDRYNYMLRTILSIEVSIDNNLHTLYFFKPQEALTIGEEDDPELERLLYKLDRTTQNSKLSSLLDQLSPLQLYMKYKEFTRLTNYSFGKWVNFFYRVGNWASLTINVLLVLTTHIKFDDHDLVSFNARYLFVVQLIQLAFGTLYSYSSIRNKFKREEMGNYIRKEEAKLKLAANEEKVHRLKAKFQQTKNRLSDSFSDLNFDQAHRVLFSCASIFLYFLICLLGIFVSPYYYSAHLFYLFSKVKVLENVYQAVFKNLQELLLLALVSIGIFLVLSVLVVGLYAPFANQPCTNMVECFVIVYSRQAYLEKQDINDPSLRVLVFEVVYGILFGSLLGNVISGLFTDKFAQLRNLHDRVDDDETNQCYICGQSRHDIEKEPSSLTSKTSEKFEKHKSIRHNKWNYLYYLYQLKQKQSTQYTGIEYFIEGKWRSKSNAWFPVCEQSTHNVRQIIQEVDQQF